MPICDLGGKRIDGIGFLSSNLKEKKEVFMFDSSIANPPEADKLQTCPETSGSKIENKKAFTVLELLVTIAIIAVLAGIILPVLSKGRQAAWRARTRDSVYQLVVAWNSYLSDYRQFPDIAITEMNLNAMNILGTTNTVYNNRYIYMEFTKTEWASGFRDKWGELYQVALDNGKGGDSVKYDGEVTTPHGTVAKNVVVWSKGPNGKDSTGNEQKDDVKSW